MKLLAIADHESAYLWDHFDKTALEGVSLILSCGDLDPSYLEFLVTMTNLPLFYVRGNHDRSYDDRPPEGCIPIDDKIVDFRGLRILGLGGSMRYRNGKDMYTEQEMRIRIAKLRAGIVIRNGFDVLLSHAPARGYGDREDLAHRGFECFDTLLKRYSPALMVHGHIHKEYGGFRRELAHPAGTRIVNAYDYQILEIEEEQYPKRGETGSPLYDLYTTIRKRDY